MTDSSHVSHVQVLLIVALQYLVALYAYVFDSSSWTTKKLIVSDKTSIEELLLCVTHFFFSCRHEQDADEDVSGAEMKLYQRLGFCCNPKLDRYIKEHESWNVD